MINLKQKDPINLIGISGKIGSGKDTVAAIIQYLIVKNVNPNTPSTIDDYTIEDFLINKNGCNALSTWQIKKFADAPKEILCILLGCTREQLESQEFKNSLLPEHLCRYNIYRTATSKIPFRANISNSELQYIYKIEKYHIKKIVATVRDLLIYLANDVFRDSYDRDIWVNILFNKYRNSCDFDKNLPKNNNWLITDVRYKNEAEIIKNKGGILIRVDRWVDKLIPIEKVSEMSKKVGIYGIYPDGSEALIDCNSNLCNFDYFVTEKNNLNNISETDLDDYSGFDFLIENNSFYYGPLIEKVSDILKIINLL